MELLALGTCTCCCCGSCATCICWTTWRLGRAALRVVRDISVRPPCADGLACSNYSWAHLERFSHPDDDDYGYAIRVHGGRGQFCTLRQCFNFMDPYQRGYVNEHAALRELLDHVGGTQRGSWKQALQLTKVWKDIDSDGNGYISFPEFVNWAALADKKFGFPQSVGIIGKKGRAGLYSLRCTSAGCACRAFRPTDPGGKFCAGLGCNHKRGLHAASREDQIRAVIPDTWAFSPVSAAAADLANERCLAPCGPEVMAQLQQLVDASVRRVWTRDRGRENLVPTGYEVVRAEHNQNVRLLLKYNMKKALMLEAITNSVRSDPTLPMMQRYEMMTSESARSLPFLERDRPDAAMNEWYLWHGASSKGVKSIAEQEFKQLYAGKTTGTLYGAGTYLSDSCTKADEYASEATEGEDSGLCCLLLCRVMGGRVYYTDEKAPNATKLVKKVLQGPYDSVFGDREKCRGTFKEVVVYESSQAYPEYLIYYRRRFEDA